MTEIKKPTPDERAAELWSHMQLHNPRVTAWDLICFCTETIAIMSVEYTFLREIAKRLVSITYTAHNAMDDMPSCLQPTSAIPDTVNTKELGISLMSQFDVLE